MRIPTAMSRSRPESRVIHTNDEQTDSHSTGQKTKTCAVTATQNVFSCYGLAGAMNDFTSYF